MIFGLFSTVFFHLNFAGASLALVREDGGFIFNFNSDTLGELREVPAESDELRGAHADESGVLGVGNAEGLRVQSQQVEVKLGGFFGF